MDIFAITEECRIDSAEQNIFLTPGIWRVLLLLLYVYLNGGWYGWLAGLGMVVEEHKN